ALRSRGDAELLQAELSAGAVYGRHLARGKGEGSGADYSRPEGHCAAARRTQQHVGVAGEGSHLGYRARRGALRAGGRSRISEQDDEDVAPEGTPRRYLL